MRINNIFTIIFLSLFGLSIILKIILDILNYSYRKKHGGKAPEGFAGLIDDEKLSLMTKYSNEKLAFSLVEYFIDNIILLAFLFSGLIPLYYNVLYGIVQNIYMIALLFFGTGFLLQTLFEIPFSLYFNFVIEKKYEFNKMTARLWAADFLKKIILTVILGTIILLMLIFFLYNFKNLWWLLLWSFFIAFSLLMQIIYPAFIAPLFNKFRPLEDTELKGKIEELLVKSGFKSSGVYEMDASKRSTHSNAYFTGIGKSKRIVLFDILLKNHSHEEILAILAHELGHYKHRHILINVIISGAVSLAGLFAANLLIGNALVYNAFGFTAGTNVESIKFIGLFLIGILIGPLGFFFNPLSNMLSRKFEFQADDFALKTLNTALPLIDALKKLSIQNLSNIYPSPVYAWFYYSHPPILQRIKLLESRSKSNEKP